MSESSSKLAHEARPAHEHAEWATDDDARRRLHRRVLVVVVISQVFGGAGLAAGVTVGALLAQDMLGGASVAGVPAALFTLGSAFAVYLVGRVSQSAGRRRGLTLGFLAGALGAAGIVVAAVISSPLLLFLSLFVYGSGTATNLQARYAGTDLAPANRRATAVSVAMVATTFGAVAGPNSVEATGRVAEALGIPALAGPFLLAAVAFGLAGLVLFVFLRPDPLLVARALDEHLTPEPTEVKASEPQTRGPDRRVLVGATVMVLTQIAMVAIMTMTPVHMRHHGHSLGQVGFVIGIHIGAMFLPSLVTGALVDRLGRIPMAAAAGATLLAAGLVAATAPGDSLTLLTLALALLGLGWNFGVISGTALLIDGTPLGTRARTQGSVDVLIALAGAGGGAMSGWVVATTSYAVLSLAGGLLALLLIPVLLVVRDAETHRRP
ncbi:putative MFS-type transporter YdeG [Nocardioides szechwanensis]|uniref:Sugar phosphate permease n=1 Tax=Nocardioides szechwanensis TaxID=1005944 RepID=A0A1H0J301_9ACTN|nr:MFS transporter [Nocardioides szechwanensis]GEP34988.1 putative MFS-type transporter YdeG [Nocardioides szechwanensis]SDO37972.1 Sugar phosphate permease [Nocardioides szechwanensis]